MNGQMVNLSVNSDPSRELVEAARHHRIDRLGYFMRDLADTPESHVASKHYDVVHRRAETSNGRDADELADAIAAMAITNAGVGLDIEALFSHRDHDVHGQLQLANDIVQMSGIVALMARRYALQCAAAIVYADSNKRVFEDDDGCLIVTESDGKTFVA